MLKKQSMPEDTSMADRESQFARKCSYCGQEEKTLIGNKDNRSFICPECIIVCAKILVSEQYDPDDMKLPDRLKNIRIPAKNSSRRRMPARAF
jgi:hypothetical protein